MPAQIEGLLNDISTLKTIIASKQVKIEEHEKYIESQRNDIGAQQGEIQTHKDEIQRLKELNKRLNDALFGRSSEKLTSVETRQGLLFNEAETYVAGNEDGEKQTKVKGHSRRKKSGRKPLPDSLPRIEIMHDLSEEEKTGRHCIGQDTSEFLTIVPEKVFVERHVYPKYALEAGVHIEGEPDVKSAPRLVRLFKKSIASNGLVAYILIAKFCDHLPFYRQEKIFARRDVELKRATMCNWAIYAARRSERLLELMSKHIKSGPMVAVDESRLQVLNETGRKNTSLSYMWLIRGGPPDKPAIRYIYRPTREADFLKEYLKGYTGVLMTDGYSAYEAVAYALKLTHAGCWDHARRKFIQASKVAPDSSATKAALKLIGRLYRLEKNAKEHGLSPEELLQLRQKKSKRRLIAFKKWLQKMAAITPPELELGKAINYTLNQWDKFNQYLDNPEIHISNILVENAVRPFAIGRKNWLFSGSPRGAGASAAIYSLIETAKANGHEPYWYLRYLFDKLPHADSDGKLRELLPFNLTPEYIQGFYNTPESNPET
ncbi:MAG: IS66 family transposase [Actinobacteria bacterium]|nr:IS66 family transposase [Actinomycetota bacterium]